jgi:hypothetical protein
MKAFSQEKRAGARAETLKLMRSELEFDDLFGLFRRQDPFPMGDSILCGSG